MSALDFACLIRQRDREAQTAGAAVAPMAPMPSEPLRCRWCGGLRTPLANVLPDYCARGCAPNTADQPPYTARCIRCDRDFATGEPGARQCWSCTDRDRRKIGGLVKGEL